MGLSVEGAPSACRDCRTRDCCFDREVPITAREVATLARTLALVPERFAVLAPITLSSNDSIALSSDDSIALNSNDRRRLLLRKRVDVSGRSRCVFLVTGGAGREVCGAGELAPAGCRAFPRVAGRGEHCWRSWQDDELPARVERRDWSFGVQWNAWLAERPRGLSEALFFHALLAAEAAEVSGASGPLPEPASRSGCDTCTTAMCCVVFDPELTGADLLRLVDTLGLDASDVATLRPTREDQAGEDAIRLGVLGSWDLRLRRTGAAEGFQGSGGAKRCGFLVDLSHPELPIANRCGVYAQRPLACRLFPSDLTAFGVIVETPEAVCPPQAWSQERADLPTLQRLHLIARAERARFRAFVSAWNASMHDDSEPPKVRAVAFMAALLAFERATTATESDQASK